MSGFSCWHFWYIHWGQSCTASRVRRMGSGTTIKVSNLIGQWPPLALKSGQDGFPSKIARNRFYIIFAFIWLCVCVQKYARIWKQDYLHYFLLLIDARWSCPNMAWGDHPAAQTMALNPPWTKKHVSDSYPGISKPTLQILKAKI